MVSGKRNRYEDPINGVNLDLTYITDRVVAMSFPASKAVEKAYRNDIDQVENFLEQNHNDGYFIYNMSNREVDSKYFLNKI